MSNARISSMAETLKVRLFGLFDEHIAARSELSTTLPVVVTQPDNTRLIDRPKPEPVALYDVNYLSSLLPLISEADYLDYSHDQFEGVRRSRLMEVGCDIESLFVAVDVDTVLEPAAKVEAINKAIAQASQSGGVVKPTSGSIDIDATRIEMRDSVILDMSNVKVNMIGDTHQRPVNAKGVRDWAVTNLDVKGNQRGVYAIRAENCDNFIVQNVTTHGMDQNSVSIRWDCTNFTIRYNKMHLVRDRDGGGTFRKQHGIGVTAITGNAKENPAQPPVPSPRFGNVYATGAAIYSNQVYGAEGLAIDMHASNTEVCGNYFFDCGYGCKIPHAANGLFHNNYTDYNENNYKMIFRLYSANDYAEGVGYTGDKLFIFDNDFVNMSSGSVIRLDLIGGTRHFANNRYHGNLPAFSVTQRENPAQKGPFDGVLYRYGQDAQLALQLHGGAEAGDVRLETNEKLQENDYIEMIRLMNDEIKDPGWAAHKEQPLPKVHAYS